MLESLVQAPMMIGGEAVAGTSFVEVRNPARLEEVVGRFPQGTLEEADRAITAAAAAFQTWREVPVAERARCLAAAGDALQRRAGEFQELFTREHGKTTLETGFDIQIAGAVLEYYGAHPEYLDDRVAADMRGTLRVRRKPIGVCGAIVPWNWPIILACMKVGPALLAGNTLVVKGPDHASMTLLFVLSAVAEHFPPGVLNVISGRGPELGKALVADERVAKVSVTGGPATGRAVAAAAGEQLKRVTLELGGNDAAILLPDVELTDDVVGNLLLGAFSTSGQICFAIKRLFVHRSQYDELVTRLRAELDELVVGDGRDLSVRMGPLNNLAQFDAITRLIADARGAGLDVVESGRWQEGLDPAIGYFVRPHLVLNPPDHAPVVAEEQFGPVLPILVYDDVDEVIARANSTPYGLCSSLWTSDEEAAFDLADRLEAGTTFINGHTVFTIDLDAPFGGVKQSGYGRELGPEGVEEYVNLHAVTNKRV
ncbi:MAG: Aldehyde dehydrogenase [Conexibacter sp.]|nr:Aldehyde dehydrogenase [Conexibacter sp.]